jgi:hypothetical protein
LRPNAFLTVGRPNAFLTVGNNGGGRYALYSPVGASALGGTAAAAAAAPSEVDEGARLSAEEGRRLLMSLGVEAPQWLTRAAEVDAAQPEERAVETVRQQQQPHSVTRPPSQPAQPTTTRLASPNS